MIDKVKFKFREGTFRMLIEKLIFNMIAFSLFIIIFAKLIKRNDTTYVIMLGIEALGIAINFIEIIIRSNIRNIF